MAATQPRPSRGERFDDSGVSSSEWPLRHSAGSTKQDPAYELSLSLSGPRLLIRTTRGSHLKWYALDDSEHQRRKPVVLPSGIAYHAANRGHVGRLDAAS